MGARDPISKDSSPTEPPEGEEAPPPHYVSFILRCWMSADGQMRVRLIDVRSGVDRPLNDVAELPAMVCRILRDASQD